MFPDVVDAWERGVLANSENLKLWDWWTRFANANSWNWFLLNDCDIRCVWPFSFWFGRHSFIKIISNWTVDSNISVCWMKSKLILCAVIYFWTALTTRFWRAFGLHFWLAFFKTWRLPHLILHHLHAILLYSKSKDCKERRAYFF